MASEPPAWGADPASQKRVEHILVTVKAYPNPSRKYIETVCVAGITDKGNWIRLYPVPYRFLDQGQQFNSYAWIEASVSRSRDHRPESHYVNIDSIKVLGTVGTKHGWQERKSLLLPLASQSLEYLRQQNEATGVSLGMIRPKKIRRLVIQRDNAQWSPAELAKLQQQSLLEGFNEDGTYQTIRELEKIPYKFKYEFTCDDTRCTGHTLSVISWEVIQSYRNWLGQYGPKWEIKFREKYEQELPNDKHDLHFYVGTVSNHPGTWTIIGLFYPPRSAAMQPALFST